MKATIKTEIIIIILSIQPFKIPSLKLATIPPIIEPLIKSTKISSVKAILIK